jgi:hypothetical protein
MEDCHCAQAKRHTMTGEMLALAIIYVLSVANVLLVKEAVLQNGGYRIIARLAGQNEHDLSWTSVLHFFSLDILLLAGVMPAAIIYLTRLVRWRALAPAVLALCLLLIGLSFVNLHALGTTGRFLSLDQLKPMLGWVQEQPGTVFQYVSIASLVKLAVLMAVVVLIYLHRASSLFSAFGPASHLLLLGALILDAFAIYAWRADSAPATHFHSPVLIQMGQRLLSPDADSIPVAERKKELQKLTFQCEPKTLPPRPAAGSANRNFVLFIMETVPFELFANAHGEGFATFDNMARSGYTATRHYSTYPFTSYARFSIFTGLYPSYRLEKTLSTSRKHPYQSFFSSLVHDGYDFKVFDPVTKRYEIDDWLIKQMGGAILSSDTGRGVEEKDRFVLSEMVDSIRHSADDTVPFVYAYLPQLTHGPWFPRDVNKDELYREGFERLKQLDKALAQIVAVLKEKHIYEKTVIVITSDHGLRTRKEAQFLKTIVLNDVSYHVPLIIHDPMMKKAVRIVGLTSHLDISPTLNCLYRERAQKIETQGKVITMPGLNSRQLFFGGGWYNGSEGLWDGSVFYSYNQQLDMAWESTSFDFDETRPLMAPSTVNSLSKLFATHGNLQEALLSN